MKKIISIIVLAFAFTQANAQFGIAVNYLAPTSSQKASLKNFLLDSNHKEFCFLFLKR